MGKWQKALALVVVVAIFAPGCATILSGSVPPEQRSGNIRWGYFVLDVLIGGPISLIVDFATGAMYEKKEGSRGDLMERLKLHASRGVPCFLVHADGIYRVTLAGGQLVETRVSDTTVPPVVLHALEEQGYRTLTAMAR